MADGATPGGYGSLSRGDIKFGTPLHALLQRRLETRMKMAESEQQKHHDRWRKAEEATLAYVPTSEADARRKARRENSGEPTFTTIQIPYSFAQLMSWHTYQTAVFLSRSPIHQIAGRDGQDEMQTQALEALLAYQVEVGRMVAPYFLWIYESGKYGNSFLGEVWDEDVVSYSTVQEAVDPLTQKLVKAQVTRQIPGYCGSRVYNISPWDFFPDPRVTVLNFQKGEFCGVRSRVMWNDLMAKARKGQYVNVDEIRTSRGGVIKGNDVGSEQLIRPVNDWQLDEGDGLNHPAQVEVDEIYVDLEPAEWKLGASTFREKWVFTVTSDHSIVIGAQPLGLMHGQFPVSMLPAEVEGQAAYARGLPEIMEPIQNTMNWLLNVHFYNVRAALNMGFILDPTKIVMKDVSKGGPGFVWRIRPEAFGQNIDTFFRQVQVQDVTQNNMSDLSAMFGIGERVFGISDQMMGAMDAGGGRKTAAEVRTSAGFGTNRSKTGAEFMSATGWGQHGQHLIANSQQFYNAEKKLRIVGDLAQIAGPEFLMVSPENIVGGWDFTPVDGTLPIDRFAQVTMWKDLLGTLATAPAILMQYDLGKIFAWVAQLAGIKNLSRFKVVPDMALQQMAAAGNSVPLGPEDTSAGQPAAGGNMNALLPPQGMGVGA